MVTSLNCTRKEFLIFMEVLSKINHLFDFFSKIRKGMFFLYEHIYSMYCRTHFFFFINNVLDKGLFLLNILNHFTASMKCIEHNNKSTNEPLEIINTQIKKRLVPRGIITKVYVCVLFAFFFFKYIVNVLVQSNLCFITDTTVFCL